MSSSVRQSADMMMVMKHDTPLVPAAAFTQLLQAVSSILPHNYFMKEGTWAGALELEPDQKKIVGERLRRR